METVSTFLTFSPKEVVQDEWEVLDNRNKITIGDILMVLFLLLLYIVPGIIYAVTIALRPKQQGFVCLTNWRLIYYEKGTGFFRTYYNVSSANLKDIVGVHAVYTQGVLGTKTLMITVHTRFEDNVAIRIGQSGGMLAKLPGVGHLFARNSMGKDALRVSPTLFSLVQQRRDAPVELSSGF